MEKNDNQTPMVDKSYLLQKFQGKGGWTYAAIPELTKSKNSAFGLMKVYGSIDGFEIENYSLMPIGNGVLMLPVKAEIRKKIGKNEGDYVHIILYSKSLPPVVPEDFLICLQDEPTAYNNFQKLSISERNAMIEWIYSVKTDEIRVERIVQSLDKLLAK